MAKAIFTQYYIKLYRNYSLGIEKNRTELKTKKAIWTSNLGFKLTTSAKAGFM